MSTVSDRLRITEIFYSLQGEARDVGIPTVFVRLTGCPLRCHYCDTSYAFTGGEWLDFDVIVSKIRQYKTKFVTVTGGEPLAQKACLDFLQRLLECGFQVSLETSGALDISQVNPGVCTVMDIKTPASGEVDRNRFDNIKYLKDNDQVKFVICDYDDYEWSCQQITKYKLDDICEVLLSPSYGQIEPAELAGWILRDQLAVRMQIQLHKLLWGNEPGH